jgi:hypothetical protein
MRVSSTRQTMALGHPSTASGDFSVECCDLLSDSFAREALGTVPKFLTTISF